MPTRSCLWPQAVFGLLHLALNAPMIYLALGLPLLMRQHGWSGLEIGLFQLAGVPALLKVLLAWPVERLASTHAMDVRYRRWAMALCTCFGLALALLASVNMQAPKPLLFALLLICVLCATWADVPVSALAIHALPPSERARAGGVRSAALFAAAVLGGGVMLVLSQRLGWGWPFGLMAALLALALILLCTLRVAHQAPAPSAQLKSALTSGATQQGFFRQAGIGRWLLLLTAYFPFAGVAWVYLKPMLLDQGFAAEQVAWVVGMGGGTLGAAVSLAVALGMRHQSLRRWLPLSATANVLVLALLALAMWLRVPAATLVAACMALAACVGLSSSIVFGLMMDFARPGHQAMDYGIQASFFALGRLALMPLAGWLLDSIGSAGLLLTLSLPAAAVAALAWRWRGLR